MVKRLLSLDAQVSKRRRTHAVNEANDDHDVLLTSPRTPSSDSQNPAPQLAEEATQDSLRLDGDFTSVQNRRDERSTVDAQTIELLQHDNDDNEDRITPVYPISRHQPGEIRTFGSVELNLEARDTGGGLNGSQRRPREESSEGEIQNVENDEEIDDGEENDEGDDNIPARATRNDGFSSCGILSSIRLDNFMSHSCFEYELGPNVNIVNGANGSGKSAIVAALQLGLGARPGHTERGSRLEDHIKHGESNAVISINILNRKTPDSIDMTYRHDIYGDVITIERKLFRGRNGKTGSSSWAVKAKKRTVKLPEGVTSRKEVMDIIDHFGFMVHNPVAILTQTKSKAFLAKGKATEHYKLYREATLLEPLQSELMETIKVTDSVNRLLSSTLKKQPQAMKQLEKLEAAHRDAQEMKNIHTRIKESIILLAWTEYGEEDYNLNIRVKITQDEFEPEEAQARHRVDQEAARLDVLKKELNEHHEVTAQITEKLKFASQARRDAQIQFAKSESEVESLKRKQEDLSRDVEEVDVRVKNVEVRMENAREVHFRGQEQKSRLVEELKLIKEEELKVGAELQAARGERDSFEDKRMTLSDELRNLQTKTRRIESDRENKAREYVQAENISRDKNRMERFGRYVPALLDSIRLNAHRFHTPPVGPVGHFIKLRDETWAGTIEQAISRATLCSFIVANARDQALLLNLVPRQGPRPVVLVMDMHRSRYAIPPDKIPDVTQYGYSTILEEITVQNDTVFNALVDFAHVEQAVLNEQDDITVLAWSHAPNVELVWNKVGERAYTVRGSKVFRSAPRSFGAMFLTKDMSRYLESLKKDLDDVEAEWNESRRNTVNCGQKLRDLQQEAAAVRQRVENCDRERIELERKRQSIEDQLNRADDAFDPTPFEKEIESLHNSKQDALKQISQCRAELEEMRQKTESCKQSLEESKKQLTETKTEQSRLNQKMENVLNLTQEVKAKFRTSRRIHEEKKSKLDRANQELDKRRQKVAERLKTATQAGPRPENMDIERNSSDKVQRQVDMYRGRLKSEQSKRGGKSAEEIEMEFIKASKQHKSNQEKVMRVKSYHKSLERGIRIREANLKRLEKTLKRMVRANFRQFLGTRGHDGNIVFQSDGDQKELVITVKLKHHEKGYGERHETTDLRSLSGGERSFTTLCFMMALAEICQNPIRVMDEIDVFQDEANRRVAFQSLVNFFQNFLSDRQVVIITPHSLPNLRPSPSCRIFKLAAPRDGSSRGQQTQIDDYLQ